jgi:hypothetical protein
LPATSWTSTLGVCCASDLTMLGDFACSISRESIEVTAAGTLSTSTPVPESGVVAKTSIRQGGGLGQGL